MKLKLIISNTDLFHYPLVKLSITRKSRIHIIIYPTVSVL